jgi:hypothetical protein
VVFLAAVGEGDEKADSRTSTLIKWQRALEAAGVEFIYAADGKGPGVRLKTERGKR